MFFLLTSIIGRKPIHDTKKQLNWQMLLRYAEYHHLITLFYYATLGVKKEFTDKLEADLYQKYKKELLLQSEFYSTQEAIIWRLDNQQIYAILLSGVEKCSLYDKKEMGSIDSIDFFVNSKSLSKVDLIMREMDYEKKSEPDSPHIFYKRSPGLIIKFVTELPKVNRYIQSSIKYSEKNNSYVKRLKPASQYICNVVLMMEKYLSGTITIRDMLDFYLYKKKTSDLIPQGTIDELLAKTDMKVFEHSLVMLGELWFGNGVVSEESGTVLALEEYILNPGKIDLSLDSKLSLSGRKCPDFYLRDREEEWRTKEKMWLFPSIEYMREFFPVLNKIPFLIVFYWIVRLVRVLGKLMKQEIEKLKKDILKKYTIKKNKGAKDDEKNEAR